MRSFVAAQLDPARLAAGKDGQRVSVCIPARDEQATVGAIVETIVRDLVERHGLVDEVLVIDDGSTDGTATVAAAAGAKVLATTEILPALGVRHGKGEALWKSLAAAEGDVVCWVDADIRGFDPLFVTGLAGPLLLDAGIDFVKGRYERDAGRVTELVARPVIASLFPHLAVFDQPLAGEYAGRRSLLERLPFAGGYAVDLALLIDVAAEVGVERMAEVDLGVRVHRNRPLDELSPAALAVLQVALRRAGVEVAERTVLRRPGRDPVAVELLERPPLATVR
jgi:glucosyl-3-phosphoglycerate synthase